MSIRDEVMNDHCQFSDGCELIELVIKPDIKELGGFSVRRSLPNKRRKMVGPWIFFDHAGPARFNAGEGVNVRPHPHINLATVTYLFDGEMLHRDSLGSLQIIRPGDINLMVAGSGIVHSERERDQVHNVPHNIHALQLWLALPEADEETDPEFLHYPASDIPQIDVEGVPVRIMMGEAYGTASPVKTFATTLYIEANLQAGDRLTLPMAEERAVYIASGGLRIGDSEIAEHSLVVLKQETDIQVSATQDSRIAVIGGEKMARRFIDWNFVSSRKERIEQARDDWREGRFPKVIGDENEIIPLPD
jgi:redox-sensitive bicupin YhaK (pirin superfamily)